ncbi:helix-turn-helix transcriptional regulator [Fusobacterium sp.]|uniref:helix-turn-helix domain-containing protein n=1 Tax=Fusobacterium sp. TaxID=68766 RepID=UPI002900622F|nr:helix-turn-helix transcriptional regulator [Fusobacterium sp.]MDU1912076.1 helix-turn-helix transcriptional regulator [Fusobacterium sp.]
MKFGEVLKKVRTQQGDSLRGLSGKTGIYFTYIDKIEKTEKPINAEILEKLVKEYPLQKKELIKAYVEETIPEFVIDEIRNTTEGDTAVTIIKNNDIKELYNLLLEELEINEQKEILKMMIERVEILSFRKGTLEKDMEKLDKIKKRITKL